ncbi:MAG TPA: universal stress protein [Ktedonobacteraceae bacterium]|nr:universal stress protein [Ktedonobacteraceae bacterium]
MFQRILVPLDGSKRAEQAVPVAAKLARTFGGSLVLLHVVTSPADFAHFSWKSPQEMQQALDADTAKAAHYLATIAASNELVGIKVTTEVPPGDPAMTMLPIMRADDVDFVVMCSHGVTGDHRWRFGSVAQKVARHSPVPVLVLREGAGVPTNLHPLGMRPVRIMVALDGSPLAEASLLPAAYLSAALSTPLQGALHLVRVLPPAWLDEDSEWVIAVKQKAVAETEIYLQAVAQRLRDGEIARFNPLVTTSVVVDPDVAGSLIDMAETGEGMGAQAGFANCDIIAMATHGRGGFEHWVMGSVTERVLNATRLPILIVRPDR